MIVTERLILRHWRTDDAGALYKYASDRRVSELALWPCHGSIDMSREVIKDIFRTGSRLLDWLSLLGNGADNRGSERIDRVLS